MRRGRSIKVGLRMYARAPEGGGGREVEQLFPLLCEVQLEKLSPSHYRLLRLDCTNGQAGWEKAP